MGNEIQLFEDKRIRTAWDEEKEEWLFSIVDVGEVLSGTDAPRRYWSDLKRKLKAEGSQLYEKIVQLKLKAVDGKRYNTDVANTEQLLRIIQSIPSPKAEPFKMWLASVGSERIDEISKAWSGMTTRQYKNLNGMVVKNEDEGPFGPSWQHPKIKMLSEFIVGHFSRKISAYESSVNQSPRSILAESFSFAIHRSYGK